MKILLPVDCSPCSDSAVEQLSKRPWPPDSEVKVITAAEIPITLGSHTRIPSPEYFEEVEKSFRKVAQVIIDSAMSKLGTSNGKTLKITSEILQGAPGQAIVEEADRWGADLIIMGSRGKGVWSRLLLGSVSNAVVHHAKCSVEIVRMPRTLKDK